MNLPTFTSCYKKPGESLNPLERFIHAYEPAGHRAKRNFRERLTALVEFVASQAQADVASEIMQGVALWAVGSLSLKQCDELKAIVQGLVDRKR